MEYCGLNLIGKVTGIAAASATQFGGMQAANNMRISLLNLGAHLCSRQLLIPEIHAAFTQDNEPIKEETGKQAAQFINELFMYASLVKNKIQHGLYS